MTSSLNSSANIFSEDTFKIGRDVFVRTEFKDGKVAYVKNDEFCIDGVLLQHVEQYFQSKFRWIHDER